MLNYSDILDTKGKYSNFINNKPYSDQYKELATKWKSLPMYKDSKVVQHFFNLIKEKQVILLVSGTGSGKTVLVPKYLLKYAISNEIPGKIAVTNPKVLTTISNAEYGAKTLDVKLGEEVGYKYKGSPKDSISEISRLLYVTDGLILATILAGDRLLSKYYAVVIDEAHERQVQIDILLRMLKIVILERPDFKLIIMSATINPEVFRDYFNLDQIKYGEMEVSGESNFPIKQIWLDPKVKVNRSNYLQIAIDKCFEILNGNSSGDGDIIVFVATQNDAINGCNMLLESCKKKLKARNLTCDKLYCVGVFSKMNHANKDLAISKDLYKKKGFERKIIFATNVAESSITFDGLEYVIDTGYELANYYDSSENSYVVTKTHTTQAQIKQRIGRSGRTKPGVAYHLYSAEQFDKLKKYPDPNIVISDIIDYVLSFIRYSKNIRESVSLIQGLITVPKIEQIIGSIYRLYFMKCLKVVKPVGDKKLGINKIKWDKIKTYDILNETLNGAVTRVGYSILRFRSVSTLLAYAVILSKYMNCQMEIITIMSLIDVSEGKIDQFFDYNKDNMGKAIRYLEDYSIQGSDHLTIYNIYLNLYKKDKLQYLNKKQFQQVDDKIEQMIKYSSSIKPDNYDYMKKKYRLVKLEPMEELMDNIYYILCLSHKLNLLEKQTKSIYTSVNFLENSLAPLEYSMATKKPNKPDQYVICHSLINAFGNKYFQCITNVPDKIYKIIS